MFDFQSEALTRIGAAAPELSAHVLSFQDLSHELPEGTNYSVGLFVVNAPGGLTYIPVIAYGVVVQPFDSLIDAMTGTFSPFTNVFIQKLMTPQVNNYGKAAKIPKHVATNPSIYNLVVPPRTGKVAYASSAHALEMISALPKSARMAMIAKIKSDPVVASAIGNAFDIQEFIAALHHEAHTPIVSVSAPEVEIITADSYRGSGLQDVAVQEILTRGYTIAGDNVTPRLAIPVESATDSFSTLSGCREGTATMLVRKDGSRVLAMIPKKARQLGVAKVTTLPARGLSTDNAAEGPDGQILAIGIDGTYVTDGRAVVAGAELEMSGSVMDLFNAGRIVPISEVGTGEIFVVVTDKGALGPLMACTSMRKGESVEMNVMFDCSAFDCADRRTLIATPAFKGTLHIDDSQILVGETANAIVLSYNATYEMETGITAAQNRQQLHTMGLLESRMTLVNHGGTFTINGKTVGEEAQAAKALVVDMGMSKQAAYTAIDTAKQRGRAEYFMSKKADMNDNIDNIPSYGNPAMEQPPLVDFNPIVEASETQDPEIMGNVIITQFMNNPDVFEMISAYVPQLSESVDKLGRTILLLRLNTDADKAASIMNILSATRNTYRLLGDSVEKIKRLSDGHATAQ